MGDQHGRCEVRTGTWTCGGVTGHADRCDPRKCKLISDGTPAYLINPPQFPRGMPVFIRPALGPGGSGGPGGPGGGEPEVWRGFVRWQRIGRDEVTVRITHAPATLTAVGHDRVFRTGQLTPCDLNLAACLNGDI